MTYSEPGDNVDGISDVPTMLTVEWQNRTWWGKAKMCCWVPLYLLALFISLPIHLFLFVRSRLPETYGDASDTSTKEDENVE